MEDDIFMSTLTNIPNYYIKESKGFIYSNPFYDMTSPMTDIKKNKQLVKDIMRL